MMIRGNEKYMDNIAKGESGEKILYKIFFKIINSGSWIAYAKKLALFSFKIKDLTSWFLEINLVENNTDKTPKSKPILYK